MAESELFERSREIVARENSFFCRQDDLCANPGRLFLAEFHLMFKLSGGSEAHSKNMGKPTSAKAKHDHQHNRKTTIHSFPLPLAATVNPPSLANPRTKT